jgi:iron complex outermembrane receptor protein
MRTIAVRRREKAKGQTMNRTDRKLSRTWVGGASAMTLTAIMSASPAFSQTVPLETIIVNGVHQNDATDVAPGSTPLDAVQPTTTVSQDFIRRNLPLSGNYDEAIKFTPSVFNTAPNGPGLAESQNISIRGFQDGQFNETFDGIPWGDSNDFTHHSTSYFMSHDLGEISVDRGPGTAATIGNATFGGTIGILSKAPDEHMSLSPYLSYGSFNTLNFGAEFNSGTLSTGTRFLLDAQGLTSDGYLTHMGQKRQNVYAKAVQPIGDNTTLTAVAMYNHVHQNISLGATKAEIAEFGPNYALSNDPTSQNYYKYNADFIKTDFEYLDLASRLGGGWSLDAKLYTYAYYHKGLNGEDPNGEFPNGTSLGANDVPGQLLTNNYRSIGTIVRLTKEFAFGDLKTGVWYDHQYSRRGLFEVDMSQGEALNFDPDTGVANAADRKLTQILQTVQPYLQFDLKPFSGFTLTSGFRYSYFDRNVNADVNVKTGAAQSYDNTFGSFLPSFEARYMINSDWSVYGQIAKGFLAPNENFFNFSAPNTTNLNPQTTWNYQVGTSFKTHRLSLSLDGYIIDFSNLITGTNVGGQTIFTNLGGVTYRGIEAEGTYLLGHGVSIYANGSLNSAKDQTDHFWVQNAPKATAAAGLIYDRSGLYASLLAKWIGPRYGTGGNQEHLSPFATLDLSLGFDLDQLAPVLKGARLKVTIDNVTNVTKIINYAGSTVQDGTSLYWTQPGRSVFASIEFKL